jgi:plastocyanin
MKRTFPWLAAFLAQLLIHAPIAAQPVTIEGVVRASGRVADLVVYLISATPFGPPKPQTTPFIDQVRLRFVPAVLAVSAGSTVEFRNSDPILHNVFSPEGPGPGFDLGTYPRTESRSHTFTELGSHVILCHVHPEMYAYVIVVPTPYHAMVNEDGTFRIDGVPPGRYTLNVVERRQNRFSRNIALEGNDGFNLLLDLTTDELEVRSRGR